MTVAGLINMGSSCADASENSVCQRECAFGQGCCARAPERCNNLWVSGDFLYWSVCEGGFECEFGDTVINTNTLNGSTTNVTVEHNPALNIDWRPGVRVGFGYDWTCSGWDTEAYWTYYYGKGHGHEQNNHASWQLHFNVVDALVGRKFWVGSCVDLRPFAGVRYARITQRMRTDLTTDLVSSTETTIGTLTTNDRQKFWGFGPEVGLQADFYFGCGWSIYGTLDGAMLYGHTDTSFDGTDFFDSVDNTCRSACASCNVQMALDVGLGIRWEFKHVTLQAGLEHHNYFDYNAIGCCGDLNLFGGNLSAAVHF
jgi:hypothetical protein